MPPYCSPFSLFASISLWHSDLIRFDVWCSVAPALLWQCFGGQRMPSMVVTTLTILEEEKVVFES